jgi:hypothetical protein
MTAGPRWMPFQSGLILTTLSIMALSHELMEEGFAFVLCGRFSQDALESLFSVIRSRGDRYPSALRFRANLRNISVSQYLTDVKSSSYIADQDEYFVDLLKPRRIRNRKQPDLPAAMDSSMAIVPFETTTRRRSPLQPFFLFVRPKQLAQSAFSFLRGRICARDV